MRRSMPPVHPGWQCCAIDLQPGYMRITALLLSFMLAVMRPAVQPLLHVAMPGFSLFASFPDLCTFCSEDDSLRQQVGKKYMLCAPFD